MMYAYRVVSREGSLVERHKIYTIGDKSKKYGEASEVPRATRRRTHASLQLAVASEVAIASPVARTIRIQFESEHAEAMGLEAILEGSSASMYCYDNRSHGLTDSYQLTILRQRGARFEVLR